MTDPRWAQVEDALLRYVGDGTFIYLMYRSPGCVKIGQAMDVHRRLTTLRHDIDPAIILMGYCKASPSLEYALHGIFAATRLDHAEVGGASLGTRASGDTEWFRFEPLLGRLAATLDGLRKAKV